MRRERRVRRIGIEVVAEPRDAAEDRWRQVAHAPAVEAVEREPREHVLAITHDDPVPGDGDLVQHRRAFRDQRRPVGELGVRVRGRHELPVGRVAVGAEIDPVLAEDRVGLELVARVDRPRLGGRADGADANRVRPEIPRLEDGDGRVLGLVDFAILLCVLHCDQQLVGRAIGAQPVSVAFVRLLTRVRLGGARGHERVRLVARPAERADPVDRRADLCAARRVDDAEILDLRAARVDAYRRARRLAIRHDAPDLRLAGGIDRDRVDQKHLAPVDPGIELRLRLALLRALKEFTPVLEERRIGAVAVVVARDLVAHPGERRRVAVEVGERRRVLRATPRFDGGVPAVLEPAVAVGQRDPVQGLDDGSRGRGRRKERAVRAVRAANAQAHERREKRSGRRARAGSD